MPKKLRPHVPEFAVHITARGVGGRSIFLSDATRQAFLARLLLIQSEIPFLIHAYCLMTNHIHLLLQAIEQPLWKALKRLLGRHAMRTNFELDRMGHLFQRRYDDAVCATESHYRNAVAYIHNNPVRAGLVANAGDWAWSSHNELMGLAKNSFICRDKVLEAFGQSLDNYTELLNRQTPKDAVQVTSALTKHLLDPEVFRELNGVDVKTFLDGLALECAASQGLTLQDVIGDNNARRESGARNSFIERAREFGIPVKEIARYLGRSSSAISQRKPKFGV